MRKTHLTYQKYFVLYCLALLLNSTLLCQTNSCDSTFFKKIDFNGHQDKGISIIDGKDGSFFIGGISNGECVIIKCNLNGVILWSVTFDAVPNAEDHLSQLILDSEGRIAGCGYSGDPLAGGNPFVFRFDTISRQLIWLSTLFYGDTFIRGILEVESKNAYLLLSDSQLPNNCELVEINKNNGALSINQRIVFDLGAAETFNEGFIIDSNLYLCGRYTNGSGFSKMRAGLTKLKLDSYNQEWTLLSHINSNQTARIYGQDFVVDDSHLISVNSGDDNGAGLSETNFFLQKTDLNGNLLWVKKYDAIGIQSEFIEEIINLPDGYLLYGRTSFTQPSDLVVVKVSKLGDVIWGRKIDFQFKDNFEQIAACQSKCINIGKYYYFTAFSDKQSNNDSDILLFKLNEDGNINDSCLNYITPLNVISYNISNPWSSKTLLIQSNDIVALQAQSSIAGTIFVNETEDLCKCKYCPPNETFENFSICNGEQYKGHSIPGIYKEVFLLPDGCDSVHTLNLNVWDTPYQLINKSICQGESFQGFNSSGIYKQTYSTFLGCDSTIVLDLKVLPFSYSEDLVKLCKGGNWNGIQQEGIYVDTLVGYWGCDSFHQTRILINELPFFDTIKVNLCSGGEFRGVSIDSEIIDTITGPNVCDTIRVYKIQRNSFYIPNVFSPNDDGENDFFEVFFNSQTNIQVGYFGVFDRFGDQVYELKNSNEIRWDGVFRGKPLNPAVFTYVMNFKCNGYQHIVGGSVTLLK